ncbi:Kelch domain-containing protein 3 [Hondaea fermentalgiana]|uniref:Kelch domain-containing protein 3 n=1 Tax=Hondaea fermentalgiana TaxID=2315210 RepID=A0A2R5G2G4_9STRA|nr:Kelch domain-containing protein 3 [Hondaea fermentalgiana]|eukprot:GBG25217.1 Kelch domain-containing protein 3 [Hondaea fermentalgiana]
MALAVGAAAAADASGKSAAQDGDGGLEYPPCLKGIACAELGPKGPASREMVFFGGEFSRSYAMNETWLLRVADDGSDGGENPWEMLTSTGEGPSKRWKSSLTTTGSSTESARGNSILLLFGGSANDAMIEADEDDDEAAGDLYDDLWKLQIADEGATADWTRLGPTDDAQSGETWPLARRAHSAVWLQHQLVIMGGRGPDGQTLSDVWAYDVNAGSFTALQEFPGEPRKGHTACVFLGAFLPAGAEWSSMWGAAKNMPSMIIFGGRKNSAEYLNDVWALAWNGKTSSKKQTWLQLDAGGSSKNDSDDGSRIRPSKRNHHTAVMRENIMLIFGGRSSHASYTVHNDLWAFDVVSARWSEVQPLAASHEKSAGRMEHCAVLLNNNRLMTIVAGQDGSSQRRNDAWTFNLETGVWNEVFESRCVAPVSRVVVIVSLVILFLGGLFVLHRWYTFQSAHGYSMI